MITGYTSGELGNPFRVVGECENVPPFFVAQQRARIYPRSFVQFAWTSRVACGVLLSQPAHLVLVWEEGRNYAIARQIRSPGAGGVVG